MELRDTIVLYEDERNEEREFALHGLVVRAVLERMASPPEIFFLERAIRGVPRNGNGNLLRAIRDERDVIASRGERLIAVFDDNKVRRLVGLPFDACRGTAKQTIGDGASICFLQDNVETLIRAARACGLDVAASIFDKATGKGAQARTARDIVFTATRRAAARPVRDRLLEEVDSFRYLVDLIVRGL